MSEADRKSDFEEAYKQGQAGFGSWQMQAKNDLKVYLGDPWNAADRRKFNREHREAMSFPLIRRNIKLISGYQRKNRLSIKYDPIENGDQQSAQIFTAAATWALQYANGYNIVSDAFEGALTTAINLVNLYNDRNQYTRFDRFFYNQFVLDANFSYRDLSDCHFGILRKYITKDAAKMLLTDKDKFIDALPTDGIDDKFPQFKAPTLYREKLLAYDEWQSRTTREQIVIINRYTGIETEWKGSKKDLGLLLSAYPFLETITHRIPTVEVTSFLGGEEVSHAIDPWGIGDFSYTPVIAFWHPEYDHMEQKLQSVVHGMVDAQKGSDIRMMAMISRFEQQIGGGLDFEEGTLIDEDDAFTAGQKPRQFSKDALAQNRARDRVIQPVDAAEFQFFQLFGDVMTKSVNINEELLGTITGNPQIAGYLAQFRAGQALVGLRDLFDNLSYSQKLIGQKLLKLIQQYTPSRIKRITNQEPTREFYTRDFGTYDAVAVEGMITDTQRNLMYSELIQLKETGNKIDDPAPIPWSIIFKYAPIQMNTELMQHLQQLEQQQQAEAAERKKMEEMAMQLQIAQAMGQIDADRSRAEERTTQAVENQTGAAYDRAKTAAEIADLKTKPWLELIKQAIALEKIGQQNAKAQVKS
jgi:hypothetical protein